MTWRNAPAYIKTIGITAGAIGSVAGIWTVAELPIPATRGYVSIELGRVERSVDNVQTAVKDSKVEILEVRRSQLDAEQFRLDRELGRDGLPPQMHEILELRRREIANQLRILDQRLDELRRRP